MGAGLEPSAAMHQPFAPLVFRGFFTSTLRTKPF